MRLDCLKFKQSKKISFRKNFLEGSCRTDMEDFNHKVQSSHPRDSAVLVVLFVHPSHVYRVCREAGHHPRARWCKVDKMNTLLEDLGLNCCCCC